MTRHHTDAARRAGQVLAGLAALALLAVLILGVPILLARLAGNPLPHTAPSLDGVAHALTTRDSGQLFLRTLTLVAWAAWLAFTLAVLVEIPAAVRRRPPLRLPGLGLPQRAAANLVAAVAMVLHSPAVASAATAGPIVAAPPPAGVVATTTTPADGHILTALNRRSPIILAAATTTSPLRANTAAATTAGSRYVVQRGDWLGYIAERYLGDFNRYPDIAALNPGLEARDHRFPDHIERHWHIVLPVDAHDRGPRPHATGHLLTTPPDGSTPRPAWTGPGDAGPVAPTSPGTVASSPAPSASPSAAPSASRSASPTPSAIATTAAPSLSPATTTREPAATAPAATNGHQPAEDDSMLDHALVIGVPLLGAGLLAALVLATLRRRRRRQEQHRPVGRRIPEPVNPKVEKDLRVVAQPIAVERLDQALRVLAAALVDRTAEQMPDIVGAWLDGEDVNLLLTTACPNPPAPWVGDHRNWRLPGAAELPNVDGQLAPLPALVAVGSRPGMHLLLDLERLGLLTVTGDPGRAGDLLRYLAAELSCNAWADHVEVTIAGFDADETSELLALGGDRIDAAPSVAVAVDRIRRRASQVVQSLDHLGAGDPLTGRIADIAADAWMPHVLLANNPNAEEVAALKTLDNDLAATGRCAVAVAVTSRSEIGRWPVTIDADGRLSIAFLGMTDQEATLTAAGLPRTELSSLADLLTTARAGTTQPGQPDALEPAGTWPAVPAAPESEAWAHGTDAAGGLLDQTAATSTDGPDLHDADPDENPGADQRDPTDDEAPDETGPTRAAISAPDASTEPATVHPAPESAGGPDTEDTPQAPAVVALVGRQPPPRRRTTTPVRRRHVDPTLHADLRAWTDADPTIPRIAILGPVTVEASGHLPPERLRFYAEIITYLAVRGQRGASTDQVDEALWPGQQVKATSRRVAITRARKWLGGTADGQPWLPDATTDRRYRLREGYLLDWHLFRRLRTRGESRGPAGAGDLRQALELVRGAPLAGADIAYSATARNPYTWLSTSEIAPHHLASAIVDTAHRLVDLCLDGGDITGARWAVDQAWLADPDRASDIAWRDLLRVAAAEGNTAELEHLLGELIQARDAEVPEDLDPDTYRLLCDLMPERMRAGVR